MRKTHPVNALKKLGIGLAFGAATIMSMPTSALACTQMYMGKNLTADGNTYYGRTEDIGTRYLKHYGIEPSYGPGHTYSSDESGFSYTSTKTTYRYSYVRDHPAEWDGRWDAYSEAGINEKGVSCSATLSTSYNDDAKTADPTTKHAHKANPEVKKYRHRRVQLRGRHLGRERNGPRGRRAYRQSD